MLLFSHIDPAEFLQAFDRIHRGRILQTASTGIATLVDGIEDDVIVVLAKLQLMAAGMTGTVQMCDAVKVVRHRGDDVAFHDLLMIDVIDHLHQRMIHLTDDVKCLTGGMICWK